MTHAHIYDYVAYFDSSVTFLPLTLPTPRLLVFLFCGPPTAVFLLRGTETGMRGLAVPGAGEAYAWGRAVQYPADHAAQAAGRSLPAEQGGCALNEFR